MAEAASVLTGGETTATTTTDGTTTAANGAWFDTFDPDTKGWVAARGYDKLDANAVLPELVKGYRGAESKLGVPADRVLKLPDEKATPEEIKAFNAKLGVPDTPEGYELPVPDGQAGEFAKTAAGWMHEAGIPKAAAGKLTAKWNEYIANAQVAEDAKFDQQADADLAALKAAWGTDFDKNVDLAKRVRRTMGISEQEAQAIERQIGLKRAAEVFSKFGGALGEHRFVGGEGGNQQFGMSPEAAKSRIGELRKDGEWMAKYTQGDADKKAEWTRLHQIAFPNEPQAA